MYDPPRHLQGLAGAVRLRGVAEDLPAIAIYAPAAGPLRPGTLRLAHERLVACKASELDRCPGRCTQIIAGDFNPQCTAPSIRERDTYPIGEFDVATEQRPEASLLLDMFEAHHLIVADTFWTTSPRYLGPRGHTSRIDHIVLPHSAPGGVACFSTLIRTHRSLHRAYVRRGEEGGQ